MATLDDIKKLLEKEIRPIRSKLLSTEEKFSELKSSVDYFQAGCVDVTFCKQQTLRRAVFVMSVVSCGQIAISTMVNSIPSTNMHLHLECAVSFVLHAKTRLY